MKRKDGKPNRVRVCNCPYCGAYTQIQPKQRGEEMRIAICYNIKCSAAFNSAEVFSWLEEVQ